MRVAVQRGEVGGDDDGGADGDGERGTPQEHRARRAGNHAARKMRGRAAGDAVHQDELFEPLSEDPEPEPLFDVDEPLSEPPFDPDPLEESDELFESELFESEEPGESEPLLESDEDESDEEPDSEPSEEEDRPLCRSSGCRSCRSPSP